MDRVLASFGCGGEPLPGRHIVARAMAVMLQVATVVAVASIFVFVV